MQLAHEGEELDYESNGGGPHFVDPIGSWITIANLFTHSDHLGSFLESSLRASYPTYDLPDSWQRAQQARYMTNLATLLNTFDYTGIKNAVNILRDTPAGVHELLNQQSPINTIGRMLSYGDLDPSLYDTVYLVPYSRRKQQVRTFQRAVESIISEFRRLDAIIAPQMRVVMQAFRELRIQERGKTTARNMDLTMHDMAQAFERNLPQRNVRGEIFADLVRKYGPDTYRDFPRSPPGTL